MSESTCNICGKKDPKSSFNGSLYCDEICLGYDYYTSRGCSCRYSGFNSIGMTCRDIATGCLKCGCEVKDPDRGFRFIQDDVNETGFYCKECRIELLKESSPELFCILCCENKKCRYADTICETCLDLLIEHEKTILELYHNKEWFDRVIDNEYTECFITRFDTVDGYKY